MWTIVPPGRITLIAVKGDYLDAIQMAEKVQSRKGFTPEGGARNIARRDGMGTVMLDAAVTIGRTPDHYFQAAGSGTGGISAWEASLRLKRWPVPPGTSFAQAASGPEYTQCPHLLCSGKP